MRSVNRGPWPTDDNGDRIPFPEYGHAKGPLIERIGEYCSYCERPGDLHLEHVVPQKADDNLITEWSNFLLGCVNCNSRKKDKNDSRDGYLWPDTDDTSGAFEYRSAGQVSVNNGLAPAERCKASALFALVGLGAAGSPTDRRRHKRRQAWDLAVRVQGLINNDNSRTLAVEVALKSGFFSVWMVVFRNDDDMRQRLVEAFPGTDRARY